MHKKRKARRVSGPTSIERSLPELTVEQDLDVVISGKKAEGLRERKLHDYKKNWQYLVEWLCSTYEEIEFGQDITTEMIRNYINYLKYDRTRYDGHTLIDSEKQGVGLKETSIFLSVGAFFLMIIKFNPKANVVCKRNFL